VPDLLADPAALRRRVTTTRELLAHPPGGPPLPVEERVAASITSLGLAARFVSPVLGAALLGAALPAIPPDGWLVGPAGPGPVGMAARPDAAEPWGTPAELAAAVVRSCLEPVVLPVLSAVGMAFGVSPRVLTGNAASAVAGAVQMLATMRPELAEPARATGAALLREGPLAGTGDWASPGRRFTRRSCCLLYRLPGATPCGDCVLHRAPARSRVPEAGVGGTRPRR
jgi:hypothetical protein